MNPRDKLILESDAYDFFVFDCDGVLLDSNKLKKRIKTIASFENIEII